MKLVYNTIKLLWAIKQGYKHIWILATNDENMKNDIEKVLKKYKQEKII